MIGTLHHAASVMKPGRIFVRRLINLSTSVQHLHYFVRLEKEAQADLHSWDTFMADWNGTSLLQAVGLLTPSISLRPDASGNWGCGAVWKDEWLQWQWCDSWRIRHIAEKEFLPILLVSRVGARNGAVTASCSSAIIQQ